MRFSICVFTSVLASVGACVPPGNSTRDAGPSTSATKAVPTYRPINLLTAVFEDNFDREPPSNDAASVFGLTPPKAVTDAAKLAEKDAALLLNRDANANVVAAWPPPTAAPMLRDESGLGASWRQAQTNAWKVEKGRLCGQGAKNHGVWLAKEIPVNARIEFDAMSDSPDGDLKAEFWGDGQSAATSISYENATSYLTIFGGWKNSLHVLARVNEHGDDRKVVRVDKTSDDARQRPVNRGQTYRFKVERTDGTTVRWFVDGLEYLTYRDAEPLVGAGHDHFGFNDWEAKVCFDNVKVTPLP